jgi:hemolysin activation/secretion protein
MVKQIFWFIAFLTLSYSVSALDFGSSSKRTLGPDQPLPLPEYEDDSDDSGFRLPDAPIPAGPLKQTGGAKFILNGLQFTGNTVFTREQLLTLVQPWLDKAIGVADLEEIRLALTNYYIQAGYINSGARLPKQSIQDGIVQFEIIEGSLTAIEIKGNERLKESYIRDRLWLGEAKLLNRNELQERFQLLLSDPLIERLNGGLRPGVQPGESILDLEVTRAQAYSLNMGFNNHRSPSSGSELLSIFGHINNLTGYGDRLFMDISASEGSVNFDSTYSIPLNAKDTRFVLYVGDTESDVIENSLKDLDIESDYQYLEAGFSHPWINQLNEKLTFSIRLALRRSQTFLKGRGVPFAAGVELDGKTKTTILRISQEYVNRNRQDVLAARSTFNFGLSAFDSTHEKDLPDGRFFSWVGQVQYARRFEQIPGQMILRTDVQWSDDTILPLERFSVGGARSVRGYRENTYVRDKGISASGEYRYPLLDDNSNTESSKYSLELAGFVDVGTGWNRGHWNSDDILSSAGVGLLWHYQQVSANLYLARAFKNLDYTGEYNLQDDGIHFDFVWNFL